jgi:uncharacterized membrane protein YccC
MDTPQLDKQLAEIAKHADGGIQKAVEFAQQQAPDLIHQLLAWHFVESLIASVIGFAMVVVAVLVAPKWIKKLWNLDEDCPGHPASLFAILGGIGMVFGGICLVVNNLDWLQIWIAPKVWLLEYMAHLIK